MRFDWGVSLLFATPARWVISAAATELKTRAVEGEKDSGRNPQGGEQLRIGFDDCCGMECRKRRAGTIVDYHGTS